MHCLTPRWPTISSTLAPRMATAGGDLRIEPAKLQRALAKGLNAERRRKRLFYVQRISKLDPQLRRTPATAALIIAGSRHTASEILKQFRCKLFLLPGNVIDPTRFTLVAPKDTTLPLRARFVGRLMPYNGPHILLK